MKSSKNHNKFIAYKTGDRSVFYSYITKTAVVNVMENHIINRGENKHE